MVTYAAGLIKDARVEVLDLNDYEIPMFSEDKEAELGQPKLAHDFLAKIATSDAIIISFAEHNDSYSVAYKNLFDWCSRIDRAVFKKNPLIFLATSPGPGDAAAVLNIACTSEKYFAGDINASLSIPGCYDNFDMEKVCISNVEIDPQLVDTMGRLI